MKSVSLLPNNLSKPSKVLAKSSGLGKGPQQQFQKLLQELTKAGRQRGKLKSRGSGGFKAAEAEVRYSEAQAKVLDFLAVNCGKEDSARLSKEANRIAMGRGERLLIAIPNLTTAAAFLALAAGFSISVFQNDPTPFANLQKQAVEFINLNRSPDATIFAYKLLVATSVSALPLMLIGGVKPFTNQSEASIIRDVLEKAVVRTNNA